MERRHRQIGMVCAALLLLPLLAACGGSPAAEAPAAAPTTAPVAEAPAAAPTAAPAAEAPAASSGVSGELTVLEWSGYDIPEMNADFIAAYPDVKVTYELAASDADFLGKVRAGTQADLVHPCSDWAHFWVEEGLVEEIDTSKLSNWSKVPENLKQAGQVDGKQYFVPWDWGYSSVLYRTDKIPEGVNSWAALTDEKYAGHISMWDDAAAAFHVGALINGFDINNLTPEQITKIKEDWIAQRSSNLFYWTGESELLTGLESGDVWLGYAWQGTYAQLLAKNIPVEYADLEEGRLSWICGYMIPKGGNVDLAMRYIDAKLGAENGTNLVNMYFYGHANSDVMSGVTDENLIKAFSLDNPTAVENAQFSPRLDSAVRDEHAAAWAEVKAAP
jgi:spermidine/putrescine transport system substrate-binding protein